MPFKRGAVQIEKQPLICHPFQVLAALRKMSSVLRLGVYRERIEKYGVKPAKPAGSANGTGQSHSSHRRSQGQKAEQQKPTAAPKAKSEELLTVTLERQAGRQLGIR